jgi:exonuclease VII large subunit
VLQRGYAIAHRNDGTVVRDAADLQVTEELSLTFARGTAAVRVERLP